ncbi:hypothetical protein M5E87_11930 [Flavonifractor plautii]|nr:hypothetical protein M5E87_11930 [Flavonifractor plautii]
MSRIYEIFGTNAHAMTRALMESGAACKIPPGPRWPSSPTWWWPPPRNRRHHPRRRPVRRHRVSA